MADFVLTEAEKQRLQDIRMKLLNELLPTIKKIETLSRELLTIVTEAKERNKRILN